MPPNAGRAHAEQVYLAGCGLPAAWAGAAQWHILETGLGLGLNFLATWAAWRTDPQRPRLLHFVALTATPLSAADIALAAAPHADLLPLAQQLQAQWHGLLPGFHRLVLEAGQLLLTICIGPTKAMLREQHFLADSIYLDTASPQRNPENWDLHTLKALARCCRRGSRAAATAHDLCEALVQCGFNVKTHHHDAAAAAPQQRLEAEFNPRWEPRRAANMAHLANLAHTAQAPGRCVVIGAGLAGASVAASLARRGWQVLVLDAGPQPASGASGLPVGVLAPHTSPDDSLLSRLSRAGVRATLVQAQALLSAGCDWGLTGVLEHRIDGVPGLGPTPDQAALAGSQPASAATLAQAGLPSDTLAYWHAQAGWIKPAALVKALLSQPGIDFQAQAAVAHVQPCAKGYALLDASGKVLAQAALVVIAAGFASRALLGGQLPLQAIRGQLSWGRQALPAPALHLPPFPVNGAGSLISVADLSHANGATVATGQAWYTGATFERDCSQPVPDAATRAQNHQANFVRLQSLLPHSAAQLAAHFNGDLNSERSGLHSWSQIRCAAPDRLPAVGPWAPASGPSQPPESSRLWACSAMGARGISLALLCAELLAARLHGEPLPLEYRLAQALALERL